MWNADENGMANGSGTAGPDPEWAQTPDGAGGKPADLV